MSDRQFMELDKLDMEEMDRLEETVWKKYKKPFTVQRVTRETAWVTVQVQFQNGEEVSVKL